MFHQLYRGALSTEAMYERITDALTVLTTGGRLAQAQEENHA